MSPIVNNQNILLIYLLLLVCMKAKKHRFLAFEKLLPGLGRYTCSDEIFHCHHTSEVLLVCAGPSRCSAGLREQALHPPAYTHKHTYNNNCQQSLSEGDILLACSHGAQYQVYVLRRLISEKLWEKGRVKGAFLQEWNPIWHGRNGTKPWLLWVTYMQGGSLLILHEIKMKL